MALEIYTYGSGSYVTEAFHFIKMFMGSSSFSSLVRIAGIMGLLWVLLSALRAKGGSIALDWSWLIFFAFFYVGLIVPKVDVVILDEIDPPTTSSPVVDNVPFGVGFIAYVTSRIGRGLTEGYETFITIPGDQKYSQNGMLFGSSIMRSYGEMEFPDPKYAGDLNVFVQNCAFPLIGNGTITLDGISNSQQLWDTLSNNAPASRWVKFPTGTVKTCRDAATDLTGRLGEQVDKAAARAGQRIWPTKNLSDAQAAFLASGGGGTSNDFLGVTKSAADLTRQAMMIKGVGSALGSASIDTGNESMAQAVFQAKAEVQQRNMYVAMGSMAARTLPVMRAVMESVAYALAPIIMLFILMPGGLGALGQYALFLLWLQMWPVLYAIINSIMYWYGSTNSANAAVGGDNSHGLTFETANSIMSVNSDMVALAGYMAMSIPMIAYMLLKGGISSGGSIVSGLMQPASSAASAGATERTSGALTMNSLTMDNNNSNNRSTFGFSDNQMARNNINEGNITRDNFNADNRSAGNINEGNVSRGNISENNTSSNKHDTNYSEAHGLRTITDPMTGARTTYTGDGGAITEMSKSSYAFGTQMTDAIKSSVSTGAKDAWQATKSAGNEYASSSISTFAQMDSFNHQLQKSDSVTDSSSRQMSSQFSSAFENMRNAAKQLSASTGLDMNTSVKLLGDISAGVGKGGASAGVSLAGAGMAVSKEDYQEAMNIAKQTGYKDSLQTARQTAIQLAAAHSEVMGDQASNQLQSTMQNNASLGERFGSMYQKASSLEQVKSYMEEKGLSLSGDIGNIMQKSLGISRDEFVQTQHAADANGDAGAHQKMQGWVNRFVDEGHVGALIGLQGAPTKDVQGDFESYKSDVTSRGGAGMEAINQSSGDAVTGARSQAGLSDTGARTPAGFGDIRKDVDAEMVDRDMEIQGSKATLDQYRDGVGGNISQMAHKSASGAAADKVIEEGAEITAGVGKVVGNAVATPVGVGVGIVNYATDKIQGKDADLGSSINAGVESARAPLNQAMDQAKGMVQGASEHHNLKQGLEAASTPSLEESWDKKKVAGSPASEPSNNASAGAPPTQDKPSGNPVEGGGRISSGFSGDRQHPVTGAHRPHTGIDIAAPHGTDVNATADGVVVFAGTKGGYGKTVDVDHGGGVVTRYAHLSDIDVKKNDKVQEGDQLGDVGSTGTSTGNHLHYEVRQNGTPVDPRPYLGNESPSEKGKGQQELQHSSDAIKEVIQGQGLTREYRQADGDIEVREGGHRNWRSNNPGNLEYGNFARNHGAIGSDGRFAIFPTMDAGTEAQKDLLKGKYGDHALQDMIPIYAPPHENDTTSYLNNIIPKGATPETKVNELNDSQFNELINKMQKHEGMKAGKTTIKDQ